MDSNVFNQLVARPGGVQPALSSAPKPVIWVILASLAKGGAERIVLDWLNDARSRGYTVHLVVQKSLPHEWPVPDGLSVIRATGRADSFMAKLAALIKQTSGRVYTHLVRDKYLETLWQAGLAVIPTVHNARAGWRNDPTLWSQRQVPFAIAVSDKIAAELKAHGCSVPIVVIRHKPQVSPKVFSADQRQLIRKRYRVQDDELFIGMIGSLKSQKNYSRALRVLDKVLHHRPAKLFIAGGYQGLDGEAEFQNLCRQGVQLQLQGNVFLPGFVTVEDVMPAFDVVLNTSDFEGFSIATQEALFSGLPVIASDVGGQSEIEHDNLTLVRADDEDAYVQYLCECDVRDVLEDSQSKRPFSTSRLWTMASATPHVAVAEDSVLFVTANLNAGGAQRSLVNLTSALKNDLTFEIAVTGVSTHPFFWNKLQSNNIDVFRPCESRNVIDIATALLHHLEQHPAKAICFWNADPKLKLLLTKFLPHHRIIDVSPGHYAFLEMQEVAAFQKELAFTEAQCYQALEALVLKFTSNEVPAELKGKLVTIPNGVLEAADHNPSSKRRLVVQGRIAPSKQLDVILDAMRLVLEEKECELHIYGQAEERCVPVLEDLLTQAAALKGAVVFHGSDPDLVARLGQFDGAVVLGVHQGCPNAVLEALAAGVPVVANDSGGTRELVIDGKTGILLPELVTPAMVAKAILALLAMDRTGLKAHAQAHAQQFSMEKMCKGYLNILKEYPYECIKAAA